MKKTLTTTLLGIAILLAVPFTTNAALTPVSWIRDTVAGFVRPGILTDTLRIPSLTNCDTIDTDADGDFSCGTDGGGGVPYTGATADVDLGTFKLITPRVEGTLASGLTLDGNGNPLTLVTSENILLDSVSNGRYASLDTSLLSGTQVFNFPDLSGTFALLANKLSDFASTTSSELAGVISDETGSGSFVLDTAPSFRTSLNADYATASTLAIFDASKNLISASTSTYPSLTELSYVKGVTSAIQTQLTGKLDSSSYDDATTAETNTGTSTTKYVSPDGLAGSYAGSKNVTIMAISGAVTTGTGKVYFAIPQELNGMDLIKADATLIAPSSSGTPEFDIYRGRQASPTTAHNFVDMLSTNITIDATEYDSKDATTASVINTSNDDVATGDVLRIDVVTAGTGSNTLLIRLSFRLP